MVVSEAKVSLVDLKIEDELNVLLASFGLRGIMHSSLKESAVLKIIDSLNGDLLDNIELFFNELEMYYLSDAQFKQFRTAQVKKFISEEQGYITAKLLKC